jgi:vancomycin resistance protein YoaR
VEPETTVGLIIEALKTGATDVILPVVEAPATVTVQDGALQKAGIREVVTVGESDFSGSPVNRRHNISVGLNRFNGHLIEQGKVFSFNDVLGPVDGTAGYRKELVIKGDRTVPDYGGGLCQVSSTAYRGIWEHGFPIVERRNHSYAVSYYGPNGTDATVYPGSIDMKFLNDGPSALLMQTYEEDNKAYFIYYGTKDDRTSSVYGPFILGTRAVPPDRTVFTTELPPGTKRKVGDRHAGLSALWFRVRTTSTGALVTEEVFSSYEARPLFYEVGVESLPEASASSEPAEPSFIDVP